MQRRRFMTVLGGIAGRALVVHAQATERLRQVGSLIGYAESDLDTRLSRDCGALSGTSGGWKAVTLAGVFNHRRRAFRVSATLGG